MCGIAGFAAKPNKAWLGASALQRMTGVLAQRGPDTATIRLIAALASGEPKEAMT